MIDLPQAFFLCGFYAVRMQCLINSLYYTFYVWHNSFYCCGKDHKTMRIVIVTGSVLRLPGHYYATQPEPEAEGMLKKMWKLLKYANCIMVTKRGKKLHP